MGYGVYEYGGRWAGYGVPAECDFPGCTAKIDRGLDYKCDEHVWYDLDDEERTEEGCGLFFCGDDRHDATLHDNIEPKPDSAEWKQHMATDESWAEWRELNPERARALID